MSSVSDFYRRRAAEQEVAEPEPTPVAVPAGMLHQGRAFRLALAEGWSDATMHIFAGPIEDDTQHTVSIIIDREAGKDLEAFTDEQVRAVEATLKGLTVIRREPVELWSGLPATRVVLEWLPTPGKRIVQEQFFVIKDGVGYRLTATFSPATFETLGPSVRAMLLSFEPG